MRRNAAGMKVVTLSHGMLHVETPLGIVNIRVDLTDRHGRRVVSVEVLESVFAGEAKVMRRGYVNTRLIECKRTKTR